MVPKLIIPNDLIVACKKMYPEIEDISFHSFEAKQVLDPTTFELKDYYKFYVMVNIHFVKGGKVQGDSGYYGECLNKIFQYTYGEKNIHIIVHEMFIPRHKTDEEIFFEIFKPCL